MAKCTKCKWFTGLIIEDECGYHYGYCTAVNEEFMLGEKDALDDAPCDFYVKDSDDNTTKKP